MWSNAKTRSARTRKRAGIEWATRSTAVAAVDMSGATRPVPEEASCVTLAPDDVDEHVSNEVGPSPIAGATRAAAVAVPRTRRLLRFVVENWAFAAAFVLASGLAWRLTFPIERDAHDRRAAPPVVSVSAARNALCAGEPSALPSAPPPATATATATATTSGTATTPEAAAGAASTPRARSTRASTKRPLPPSNSSELPAASPAPAVPHRTNPTNSSNATPHEAPDSESRRALDRALTELASY